MPYPDCITLELQKNIKYNYAMKQFAAALSCISEDPTLPWATLLAIQGAPLLMTLVRKGKVTALTYHRTYIVQLASPMYVFLLGDLIHWNRYAPTSTLVHDNAKAIFVVAGLHLLTTLLRVDWRRSKFTTWTISVALMVFFTKVPVGWSIVSWFHAHPVGIAIILWRYIAASQGVMRHYVPVFTLASKAPEDLEDVILEFIQGVFSGKWSVRVGMQEADAKKKSPTVTGTDPATSKKIS